jgi:hypothetical protein
VGVQRGQRLLSGLSHIASFRIITFKKDYTESFHIKTAKLPKIAIWWCLVGRYKEICPDIQEFGEISGNISA